MLALNNSFRLLVRPSPSRYPASCFRMFSIAPRIAPSFAWRRLAPCRVFSAPISGAPYQAATLRPRSPNPAVLVTPARCQRARRLIPLRPAVNPSIPLAISIDQPTHGRSVIRLSDPPRLLLRLDAHKAFAATRRSFAPPRVAAARYCCSARLARAPPLRGYPTHVSFRSGRVVSEIAFLSLLARI